MLDDDAEPTHDGHKSAGQLFDEAPSWYDAPELTEQQLDPNIVPPKHQRLGDTSGMGSLATHAKPKGMDPARQTMLVGVAAFFFLGGGALLLALLGVFGNALDVVPQEFTVGECVNAGPGNNELQLSVEPGGCGDDSIGRVLGTFEAVGLEQMPAEGDPFWNAAADRCLAMDDGSGFVFALPAATTNSDWESGNHTIVCTSAFGAEFDEAMAEFDEAMAAFEAEIDQHFEELE